MRHAAGRISREKDGKTPMRKIRLAAASAALIVPGLAFAQASPTDERRLTPAQVEAVLADAAAKRAGSHRQIPVDAAPGEDSPAPAPQVHGEVGFAVGTGGYREAYGTAVYPLQDGVVAISFDFADWGRRRWPR